MVSQACNVALMNMFLQKRQGGHTAMSHDLIIRDDRNVHQREGASIKAFRHYRIIKFVEPAGRPRIGSALTGIEQYRYD